MKKTISVILIITMLMSVLCLNSFAGALSLVSAPSTANKGDTITVSVNVPVDFRVQSSCLNTIRLALSLFRTAPA